MSEKTRTKNTSKRISFKLGRSGKAQKQRAGRYVPGLKLFVLAALAAASLVCLFAGIRGGFVFLDGYVIKNAPLSETISALELTDVPQWVNQQLREKILAAACADGKDIKLDEDAARSVYDNLKSRVAWLEDISVQVAKDRLLIRTKWRKPLGLLKLGVQKFYVDANLVVLDFVPVPELAVVQIKGVGLSSKVPPAGKAWHQDDLAAAVAVLDRLDRMDRLVTPDKPLLAEIESIDVGNFNGRENSRQPHIALYAKDGTQIIWGAEIGKWSQHLESTDADKLNKLYSHYKAYGSLLKRARYINLCDPQDDVPLPIDKY